MYFCTCIYQPLYVYRHAYLVHTHVHIQIHYIYINMHISKHTYMHVCMFVGRGGSLVDSPPFARKGRGFESLSSRHLRTLGKSFTPAT